MASIALFSAAVAFAALIDTRKRYNDSIKPVITFRYTFENDTLFLSVRNEGKSPVQSFSLTVKNINGCHPRYPTGEGDLMSGKTFDLYPGDVVSNQIGLFPRSNDYAVPPSDITVEFSYRFGSKDVSSIRTVGLYNPDGTTFIYRRPIGPESQSRSCRRRDRLPARGAHGEGARIRDVAVAEGAGHATSDTPDRDKVMLPVGPSIPAGLDTCTPPFPEGNGAPGE